MLSNTVLKLAVAWFFGSQPFRKIAGDARVDDCRGCGRARPAGPVTDHAVNSVGEAPGEPRFARGVIVPGIDRLSEYVRVIAPIRAISCSSRIRVCVIRSL